MKNIVKSLLFSRQSCKLDFIKNKKITSRPPWKFVYYRLCCTCNNEAEGWFQTTKQFYEYEKPI